MEVHKYQSKKTYKNKEGVEKHYYGYSLICDNGQHITIKCLSAKDYARLDMVAKYVNTK